VEKEATALGSRGQGRGLGTNPYGNPSLGNHQKTMQAVCDVLERLITEGVIQNYALGGATAAGFHGEPLATRDIDVFVFFETGTNSPLVSLSPLFTCLKAWGFDKFEEEMLLIHDYPVQFLMASSRLETESMQNALVMDWDQHRIRVMRAEHLAALALTVGRPKDRARVVYLVNLPQFDHAQFRNILHQHQLTEKWIQWAQALDLKP
jgi:hypothetical protein